MKEGRRRMASEAELSDLPVAAAPGGAPASEPARFSCRNFYHLICGRRRPAADPTGIVQADVRGEVEALRLYEKILHENPTWTSDQVDEELVKAIYTDRRRRKLIDV